MGDEPESARHVPASARIKNVDTIVSFIFNLFSLGLWAAEIAVKLITVFVMLSLANISSQPQPAVSMSRWTQITAYRRLSGSSTLELEDIHQSRQGRFTQFGSTKKTNKQANDDLKETS
jgi:hypothetical protein